VSTLAKNRARAAVGALATETSIGPSLRAQDNTL
jgi:hypothetical protein